MNIVIFGKDDFETNETIKFFDENFINYDFVNIEVDDEGLEEFIGFGGKDRPIVFVNNLKWFGYRIDLLEKIF